MAAILRWFQADGVRHRAYFRSTAEASIPELVVAAPEWEAAKPASKSALEDYTDEELVHITLHLRERALAAWIDHTSHSD